MPLRVANWVFNKINLSPKIKQQLDCLKISFKQWIQIINQGHPTVHSVDILILNQLRNSDLVVRKNYSFLRQNFSSQFRNTGKLGFLPFENPEIPVGKSNGTHHSIWSILLKLWASGQNDLFLLLLLGFTADIHTFCMSSIFCQDKLNHFVFMQKISIGVACTN